MKKRLPIYTTSEGRAKYMTAYEAMFSLWKVPHDALDLETSYGSTHINVSGPIDGYPLILLHAVSLSSTAWFANIAELSATHRVYAVDGIGDAGKSIAECLLEKRSDYAEWLREVFDGLNIDRGYLVGAKYGAGLSGAAAQNRFAGPCRVHLSDEFADENRIASTIQGPSSRTVCV